MGHTYKPGYAYVEEVNPIPRLEANAEPIASDPNRGQLTSSQVRRDLLDRPRPQMVDRFPPRKKQQVVISSEDEDSQPDTAVRSKRLRVADEDLSNARGELAQAQKGDREERKRKRGEQDDSASASKRRAVTDRPVEQGSVEAETGHSKNKSAVASNPRTTRQSRRVIEKAAAKAAEDSRLAGLPKPDSSKAKSRKSRAPPHPRTKERQKEIDRAARARRIAKDKERLAKGLKIKTTDRPPSNSRSSSSSDNDSDFDSDASIKSGESESEEPDAEVIPLATPKTKSKTATSKGKESQQPRPSWSRKSRRN